MNTNQGVSIVEVYKEYVQPTETESKCQQVHNFRDFLTGIQIHGYALGLSPFFKNLMQLTFESSDYTGLKWAFFKIKS